MKLTINILALWALLSLVTTTYAGFPNDLSDVEFIESPQVKSWPIGSTLPTMTVANGFITIPYSATLSWPRITINSTQVVSNAWGIVKKDGRWKAGTWEWLRPGQISKPIKSFHTCCHFKPAIGSFTPRNGDIYGFFVSGTIRSGINNIPRRTNYVVYEWGKGVVCVEGNCGAVVPTAAIDLLLEEARMPEPEPGPDIE